MSKPLIKLVLWLGIILGAFVASPVSAQVVIGTGEFYTCYTPSAQGSQYTCQFFEQPAQCVAFQNSNTEITGAGFTPCQREVGGATPGFQERIDQRATELRTTTPPDDFGLECGIAGLGGYFSHCIALIGYGIFYYPATWIVSISGYIFDALLAFSLSGEIIGNQSFVEDGWRVVRNISNLVFIFFLLYIAIKTILGLGDWKKSVVPVIIVALLINFSLFFTKIVIDASNILAYQFYNNIGSASTSPIISESSIGFPARTISQHLVARINPQALANINTYADWERQGGKIYMLFVFFLATGIILLVIAYVLFKAAFLMLGRLIAFWFLMIFSPMAFLGFAFPQAQKVTGEWTKKLTDQALVAPVFLFFLYMVSIIVDSGIYDIQMGQSATDTTMVLVMIVLKTAVFVALMLYALKTTKDLSGEFGGAVTSYVGKAAGFTLGATAFASRHTVGRAASKLVDENTERGKKFRDWASKSRFGEMTFKTTKDLGGATFDARNTSLGKKLDLDLGKGGGKGGYQKMLDTQTKERKDFAKELAKGRDGEEADKIKEQYAQRISTTNDPETLFTKTARKNKDAAKQIMKDVNKSRNTRNVKENEKKLAESREKTKKLTEQHKALAMEDASLAARQRTATGQSTPEDNARGERLKSMRKEIDDLEKQNADLEKRIREGKSEKSKKQLQDAVKAATEGEEKPKDEKGGAGEEEKK